jgi:hypothetical protein
VKRSLTFALLGPALAGLVIGCVIRESWTHVWYIDLIGFLIGGRRRAQRPVSEVTECR